jgi:hypothetical protein
MVKITKCLLTTYGWYEILYSTLYRLGNRSLGYGKQHCSDSMPAR